MAFAPIKSVADSEYFLGRAFVEMKRAEHANPRTAAIRQTMVSTYLKRVFGSEATEPVQRPVSDIDERRRALFQGVRKRLDGEPLVAVPNEFARLLRRLDACAPMTGPAGQ